MNSSGNAIKKKDVVASLNNDSTSTINNNLIRHPSNQTALRTTSNSSNVYSNRFSPY